MKPLTVLQTSSAVSDRPARPRQDRIGLVLADAHPIVLAGMQHLFQREPDLEVLECCTSTQEVRAAVERHRPAVLVLDLHLPPRGGLVALRDIPLDPRTRVVLAAGTVGQDSMTDALRLGVRGVVLKEMTPDLMVKCIRQVQQGAMWLEHSSAFGAVNRLIQQESDLERLKQTLTRRELEVLQLVAGGLRNKDITCRLKITEGTVKIHLHNIYGKLGLRDRVDLVIRARESALA